MRLSQDRHGTGVYVSILVAMPTILIVDDEPDILNLVQFNLQASGFDTETAADGTSALERARATRPDLVVLDLMLPDISGTEVCRRLKEDPATRHIPVLMLTAKSEEVDRVVGFELGADDYVVKPFSVRELSLRVNAILRRSAAGAEPHEVTTFGRLRVDPDAHRAYIDGKPCELTALEFRLLHTLVLRRGRVQTRETLLDDVWGHDAAIAVTTRTVDTHVKRLRQKLGPIGGYIETVRGVGYRLMDSPPEDSE